MGKYQLDAKGHKNVEKFHEKNSLEGGKVLNPRQQQLDKIAKLKEKMKGSKK